MAVSRGGRWRYRGVRNPAAFYVTGEGQNIGETVQCVHCMSHIPALHRLVGKMGFCMNCSGPKCSRKECQNCTGHWRKKIEEIGAGKRKHLLG
jgi:hypothetical protein